MKRNIALAAAILFAAAMPPASAAVVNGDFEPGNLNGWYSTPTTAIANGSGTSTYAPLPLQGTSSALIVAVSTAAVTTANPCAVDVWNVSCAQPLPFVSGSASAPTHGAPYVSSVFIRGGYIAQDVLVAAGDVLSWNWLFAGIDSVDGARFYASDGSGTGDIIQYSTGVTSYTFNSTGL